MLSSNVLSQVFIVKCYSKSLLLCILFTNLKIVITYEKAQIKTIYLVNIPYTIFFLIIRQHSLQISEKNIKTCQKRDKILIKLRCKLLQGSKFIFGFGSTCKTRSKILGALPKL